MTAAERILLVEDDKAFADELAASLRDICYEVITAYSGNEALRLLEKAKTNKNLEIAAVVSDWVMGNGDGIELLKNVRTGYYREIPFVLMSGQVDRDQLLSAMKLGADAVVLKPFTIEQLVEKIVEATFRRESKSRNKKVIVKT